MDFDFRGLTHKLRKIFPTRIRRVQTNNTWLRPALRICTLLTAAGTLGYLAMQTDRAEALAEWQRTHPPSKELWSAVLTAQGFNEIKEPKLINRVLRKLPVQADDPSAVWRSHDGGLVAIADTQKDGADPKIFSSYQFKTPPTEWRRLAESWSGLSVLLKELQEESRKPAIKPQQTAKKTAYLDPRAIQY